MYQDEIIVPAQGTTRFALLANYRRSVEICKEKLAKFAADLQVAPVYALQWADKQFMHAATLQVSEQVVHMLEHCTDIKDLVDTLTSNVMSKARCINNTGSSTSSGFVDQCMLACRAEVLEEIKHVEKLD